MWLSQLDDDYNGSHMLTIQLSLAPRPDAAFRTHVRPLAGYDVPQEVATFIRALSTPPLPVTHRS